jgi:hypothetical protein
MVASPSYWSSDSVAARARRFGRFLVIWRKRCGGWSQYQIPDWSRECGFIGPAVGSGRQAPEITRDELARVNSTLADGFRNLLRDVRPFSRAMQLAAKVAPPAEREAYEDALGGIGYERATLMPLWDSEAGEWAPLVWWSRLQVERGEHP